MCEGIGATRSNISTALSVGTHDSDLILIICEYDKVLVRVCDIICGVHCIAI